MNPYKEQSFSPAGLTVAHIRLDRLRANWRHLCSLAADDGPARPWPALMPVVKADAYGHGIVRIAQTLTEEGARAFAVGSVAEGSFLRQALACPNTRLLPLLGVRNADEARACVEHDLTPLVHSTAQLDLLAAAHGQGKGEALPVAVKIDTGMSRLGFAPDAPAALLDLLRSYRALSPTLLVSHLAAADEPAALDGAQRQIARFRVVFDALRSAWPDIPPSLANSPGTLAEKSLFAGFAHHVRRPGYALHGGNPFAGTSLAHLGKALLPVMEVSAPVLSVHDLAKGETVSYNRTFTAPRAMRVAVIGAGYADGYSRSLSGKGSICLHEKRCPILGRVCMQMHIVDVSHLPEAAAGDTAYLLGGSGPGAVSAEELAAAWGTIPYEVFCLLGKNPRVHHDAG